MDKTPEKLIVLLSGNIALARDLQDGRRSLSKSTTEPGELFGQIRLFSAKKLLWEYAVALENSPVLELSSTLFLKPSAAYSDIQVMLYRNLMSTSVDRIDDLADQVFFGQVVPTETDITTSEKAMRELCDKPNQRQ